MMLKKRLYLATLALTGSMAALPAMAANTIDINTTSDTSTQNVTQSGNNHDATINQGYEEEGGGYGNVATINQSNLNNSATITQISGYYWGNDDTIIQSGQNNEAVVYSGYDNQTSVEQLGDSNEYEVVYTYWYNTIDAVQNGDINIASIEQLGASGYYGWGNSVSLDQGTYTWAFILQDGDYNSATVSQYYYSTTDVTQTGLYNEANVTQTVGEGEESAYYDYALVEQNATGTADNPNTVSITQTGYSTAYAYQYSGEGNSIDITQSFAGYNTATVTQDGSFNTAVIDQTNSEYNGTAIATTNQIGTGNSINVNQDAPSGITHTVNITQAGNNNSSNIVQN